MNFSKKSKNDSGKFKGNKTKQHLQISVLEKKDNENKHFLGYSKELYACSPFGLIRIQNTA